jgi:hypothetical protein
MIVSLPRLLRGLPLAALLLEAALVPAGAQVTAVASRTSLLYSSDANPDCSALHAEDSSLLPFNVARISVVGAPTGSTVQYRWSMPKSDQGIFAADENIMTNGTGGPAPAISGMCSDFGNACILTRDNLGFYNQPTIFFLAPTCDVLPANTKKQFKGGVSHVKVKVKNGNHKVGTGKVNIEWGKNGSVTLFVSDMEAPPVYRNGLKGPNPVSIFANPNFAWAVTPPNPGPSGPTTPQFSGGGTPSGQQCVAPGFDGCTNVVFGTSGKFIELLALEYNDGSELCDNLAVRVAECAADPKLDVIPKPKRSTYDPASPAKSDVNLTVRLRNASKARGGLPACNFLLQGAGVLTCSAALKVAGLEETKTTTFDLQHCSVTTDQGCLTNADCACPDCQPNEICLTQPHCSVHFTQLCGNDADCQGPGSTAPCPTCQPGETCVRILEIENGAQVFLVPGQSVDLLQQPFTLRNTLGDKAKLTDTWTANIFIPATSVSSTLKYKIRGRPQIAP